MCDIANENVCSVIKENKSGYYRLHTIWKSNGFALNVTSENGAWRGEMTDKDLKTISSQLNLEPDTYLQQCKEALTCHNGQPKMVYAVENGCFTWKKVLDEDSGIKLKMGFVRLVPSSFEDTIQKLVSVALNHNNNLQIQLEKLQKERVDNNSEREMLLSKLNELIHMKNEMETDLYSRFLLLLNSKKKKILELENMAYNDESNLQENPYEVSTNDEGEDGNDSDNNDDNFDTVCNLSLPKRHKNEIKLKCKKTSLSISNESGSLTSVSSKRKIERTNSMENNGIKISKNNFNNEYFDKSNENKNDFKEGHNLTSNIIVKTENLNTKVEKANIPSTNEELLDFFYHC